MDSEDGTFRLSRRTQQRAPALAKAPEEEPATADAALPGLSSQQEGRSRAALERSAPGTEPPSGSAELVEPPVAQVGEIPR